MIKLYYAPKTRSTRPRWMLEELGVPYEIVPIDMVGKQHKSPEYLKIHPHGVVPALDDHGIVIYESAAICAYLADKYFERGLIPRHDSPQRALYFQWMFYSVVTLDPPVVNHWLHTTRLSEEKRNASIAEDSKKLFGVCAKVLSTALEDNHFILGDQFTAPDVLLGALLSFAGHSKLLTDYPVLQRYVKHVTDRPAYQRAQQV